MISDFLESFLTLPPSPLKLDITYGCSLRQGFEEKYEAVHKIACYKNNILGFKAVKGLGTI